MTQIVRWTLPARLDHRGLLELERRAMRLDGEGVVVLTGASPQVFCEGLDLEATGVAVTQRRRGLEAFEAALLALLESPQPSVAAVCGRALGGGWGIAAACDILIAGEDARFALPEPLFGLIPGLITPVLLTRTSSSVLKRLAIAGESIGASEALRLGLVDEVVPASGLERRVGVWARRVSRAHRPAVGRLKRWLSQRESLRAEIGRGRAHMEELFDDDEVLRRIARFRAGEAPWGEQA